MEKYIIINYVFTFVILWHNQQCFKKHYAMHKIYILKKINKKSDDLMLVLLLHIIPIIIMAVINYKSINYIITVMLNIGLIMFEIDLIKMLNENLNELEKKTVRKTIVEEIKRNNLKPKIKFSDFGKTFVLKSKIKEQIFEYSHAELKYLNHSKRKTLNRKKTYDNLQKDIRELTEVEDFEINISKANKNKIIEFWLKI